MQMIFQLDEMTLFYLLVFFYFFHLDHLFLFVFSLSFFSKNKIKVVNMHLEMNQLTFAIGIKVHCVLLFLKINFTSKEK